MRSSLRWRLQSWHGLILLLVIAGFGLALHIAARRATFREIDAELQAGARVIEGVLRPYRSLVRVPGVPPDPLGSKRSGPPTGESPPPAGEEGRGSPAPGPPGDGIDWRTFELSPSHGRGRDGVAPRYSVIWLADGTVFHARPPEFAAIPRPQRPDPRRPRARLRDGHREVAILGPNFTTILVGREIGPELLALDRLAGTMAASGLAIFAFGLLGGWWLSGRAVRPIEEIGATVAGITAEDLSARIELADFDREFDRLGAALNAMLDRLEASFAQQFRFTADASHELRTPLTVLRTHVELALARPRRAEEYRETIVTCQRAAARMESLVEDLLTLARVDAGALDLKLEAVDLGRLVEEQASPLGPLAASGDVRVEVAAAPVLVEADAARLGRVVTNLLSNAIAYNRPGGAVTVSTAREGDSGVIRVADTGVGIPEGDRERLFDRFYQVDLARSRRVGGSGLGLPICKGIVEAHGGSIRFASTEGVGTTFEVALPLRADRPSMS